MACCYAAPAPVEDGKYHPENDNSGRYIPSDEGTAPIAERSMYFFYPREK